MRGPGHSLLRRIEDLNLDIDCYVMMMVAMPLLLFASYLSTHYFGVAKAGEQSGIIYALVWLAYTLYFGKKLCRLLADRHAYRLGLDCEMAVGQELNNLMSDGYRVFHDVPAEGFNIDHVVVGRNGVFAVETKGRSKPARGGVKVVYDGRTLRFPDRIKTDFLDQAKRQAEWLSRSLSDAVGMHLPVQPVLVLPGWYIERVRRGNVLVLNGKDDYRFITTQWTHSTLSRDVIHRAGDILEQACRDAEPISYRQKETERAKPGKVFGRIAPLHHMDRASGH